MIYKLQDIYCKHITCIFSVYDILWKLIFPYKLLGFELRELFSGNSNVLDIAQSGLCQKAK